MNRQHARGIGNMPADHKIHKSCYAARVFQEVAVHNAVNLAGGCNISQRKHKWAWGFRSGYFLISGVACGSAAADWDSYVLYKGMWRGISMEQAYLAWLAPAISMTDEEPVFFDLWFSASL